MELAFATPIRTPQEPAAPIVAKLSLPFRQLTLIGQKSVGTMLRNNVSLRRIPEMVSGHWIHLRLCELRGVCIRVLLDKFWDKQGMQTYIGKYSDCDP